MFLDSNLTAEVPLYERLRLQDAGALPLPLTRMLSTLAVKAAPLKRLLHGFKLALFYAPALAVQGI